MADYYGASDIDGMLAEFGAPVGITVNGQDHEAMGLVDETDEVMLRDGELATAMVGKSILVTIKTGALPGFVEGAAITVGGEARRVIGVRQLDDGALTRAMCARA